MARVMLGKCTFQIVTKDTKQGIWNIYWLEKYLLSNVSYAIMRELFLSKHLYALVMHLNQSLDEKRVKGNLFLYKDNFEKLGYKPRSNEWDS